MTSDADECTNESLSSSPTSETAEDGIFLDGDSSYHCSNDFEMGFHASLVRCLASKPPGHVLRPVSRALEVFANGISTSVGSTPEFHLSSLLLRSRYGKALPKEHFLRYFHATPELLAKRKIPEFPDKKKKSKGKFNKRVKQTQPPVEARYVAPKLKKSVHDKTVDIFEGMTVVELAKRTGESITLLQDILVNVGEKVATEFEPFSIDVAELVAMIHLYGTALGGLLAQLFAQHRPRRVRSLVLSNTFMDTQSFSAAMPWAPLVSWSPSFFLKRYVLTGIRDGPHEPFIADSVDFVVSQVETLSREDLASRLTLTVDAATVGPFLLSDSFITIMDVLEESDSFCKQAQISFFPL